MKEFDQLCKEFEQLDALTYTALLAEKAKKILPALSLVTGDDVSAVSLFSTFLLGAIAADGRVSEEEYALCYPLLYAFFGEEVNYDDCKAAAKAFKAEGRELVCLMICAVDGKVSMKEKSWIKKLVR